MKIEDTDDAYMFPAVIFSSVQSLSSDLAQVPTYNGIHVETKVFR